MNRLKTLFPTLILIWLFPTVALSVNSEGFVSFNSISVFLNSRISAGDDVDELIKTAFELYRQKKYEESLKLCVKAVELNPSDFRPHSIIGLIYLEQQKFKEASEEFTKSISLNPDNSMTYFYKAEADKLRGEKEEAINQYRKAIELEPNFAQAYWQIGDILIENEKRRDEAFIAYQSALKINPKLSFLYEYLGEKILNTKKDEKLAEYIFRKQIAADEKRMIGRFALGRLLVKQGRLKEARELWEGRSSSEDRTFPNFITVLERAEKLQEATEELAKNPDKPDSLLKMGFAVMDGDHWVVDGRQEKAIEYFEKALKLKPDFAMAQYAICKAYVQIANTYKSKNKNLDEELLKLRKLDAKLAQEIEDYRKTYKGGFTTVSPPKTKP